MILLTIWAASLSLPLVHVGGADHWQEGEQTDHGTKNAPMGEILIFWSTARKKVDQKWKFINDPHPTWWGITKPLTTQFQKMMSAMPISKFKDHLTPQLLRLPSTKKKETVERPHFPTTHHLALETSPGIGDQCNYHQRPKQHAPGQYQFLSLKTQLKKHRSRPESKNIDPHCYIACSWPKGEPSGSGWPEPSSDLDCCPKPQLEMTEEREHNQSWIFGSAPQWAPCYHYFPMRQWHCVVCDLVFQISSYCLVQSLSRCPARKGNASLLCSQWKRKQ